MSNNRIVISRIQNRRGIKENLPQPLLPGEFALTVDTGELWIGTDPAQPPWGVRTYGSGGGDISTAESIVDLQIVSAKFTSFDALDFEQLVDYLTGSPTPAVVLTEEDILWDGDVTVFVAADTSVDSENSIGNVVTAIGNSPPGPNHIAVAFDALGAINDPTTDPVGPGAIAFDAEGTFLLTIEGSNSQQGANAALLINRIHGAELVTTLSNLQITTSGVGVGSSTFRDWQAVANEGDLPFTPIWSDAHTLTADSITDKMWLVSGPGILIELNDNNPNDDAIRITNTFEQDFDILYAPFPGDSEYTLADSVVAFTNVPGLTFDIDTESDVIFLDYSARAIDGANTLTIIGSMRIVGSVLAADATLTDTQTEIRDGIVGAIAFQATYNAGSPNTIRIQYTNTITVPMTMRVVQRRWASF